MKPQGVARQAGQAVKQTSMGLAQIAAQNAKAAGETAKRQVGVLSSEGLSELDNEDPGIGIVSEIKAQPSLDAAAINAQAAARYRELEATLARIRQEQAQKAQAHAQLVEAQMQPVAPKEEKEENFFQKITKRIRGKGGPPNKKAEHQKNKG